MHDEKHAAGAAELHWNTLPAHSAPRSTVRLRICSSESRSMYCADSMMRATPSSMPASSLSTMSDLTTPTARPALGARRASPEARGRGALSRSLFLKERTPPHAEPNSSWVVAPALPRPRREPAPSAGPDTRPFADRIGTSNIDPAAQTEAGETEISSKSGRPLRAPSMRAQIRTKLDWVEFGQKPPIDEVRRASDQS